MAFDPTTPFIDDEHEPAPTPAQEPASLVGSAGDLVRLESRLLGLVKAVESNYLSANGQIKPGADIGRLNGTISSITSLYNALMKNEQSSAKLKRWLIFERAVQHTLIRWNEARGSEDENSLRDLDLLDVLKEQLEAMQ